MFGGIIGGRRGGCVGWRGGAPLAVGQRASQARPVRGIRSQRSLVLRKGERKKKVNQDEIDPCPFDHSGHLVTEETIKKHL